MSIFDKSATAEPCSRRLMPSLLLVGAILALTLPSSVRAGGHGDEGGLMNTAMEQKADARPGGGASGGYELRCWQYGRLIMEENLLQLPPESSSDALRMNDSAGRPVRVLETANATCLLKAVTKRQRALRP